jgi:iron complex transport system substrate-binding protein
MTSTTSTRRARLAALLAAGVLVLAGAACSDDPGDDGASGASMADPPATVPITDAPEAPSDTVAASSVPSTDGPAAALDANAPDLGRVVALAEEFVLADLLALGVTPIASTATVDAAGFQGLDEFDISGIEVLPQTTLSLEYLASLQPDTIVTLQFWVDQVGADVLEGIAEVVVVPDGLSGADQIETLGELLGRPERAGEIVAELDAAAAEAAEAVAEGCTVSLASVYPGPAVAAFVDGPSQIPTAFQTVGCEILPGPDDATPDANGRAWLSEEQYGLLDQDVLVLMQSESVEGEADALAQVESSPLWATLPAVQAGDVVVIDRLGYPGATGLARLYAELPSIVAP